jgi:hypothetical protein
MRIFVSFLAGAASAAIAILLHQSLPPFGVAASIALTYSAIWWIGRNYHNRLLKWVGAFGWIVVILRGSSFGVGQELLVQGDGVGSALLLIGTLAVLFAVAARN